MTDKTIDSLIRKSDALFGSVERSNSDHLWNELAEYMLNNQHGVFLSGQSTANAPLLGATSVTPGVKKTKNVYDSTALQAVQDLAAAFQGTLTNPATVWSKLRFQNDELNNNEEAVQWLESVNNIIHKEFSESNFDTEVAKAYQSFVSLANMVLMQEERINDDGTFGGFRFTSMHLGQIAWAEDKDGLVDTMYRKFNMTGKQLVEKFGEENLHKNVVRAAEKEPHRNFELMHCIFKRDPKEVKLNELGLAPGDKRPIASVYIDVENKHMIEEGGFYEFPSYVARWSLMPGEVYGRGPGHLALPDTRTLNRLKKRGLEAIDLQVRPPMLANQRDVFGQLDLRPGAISIVKDHNGVREFVSQSRADILQFSVEELRASIRGIFFLDKLLLPDRTETGEMTAFEVSQRLEQMQRVLGPTLSRINSEFLSPLVVRSFKMLLRAGALPSVPRVLQELGIDIDIVFVNQLARAQQVQDVSTIQQWVQNLGTLAQLVPEVIDNINGDGIAKHTARILGVPEIAVTDDEQVEQIREQRAQQAQQQEQLEAANLAADTIAKTGGLSE